MARHLSIETKRQILAALAAGEKHDEVALRFGVHSSYPRILRRRGFREDVVVLTDDNRAAIAREYAAGIPRKDTARRFGITETTVSDIALQLGCTPRRADLRREDARA